MGYSKHRRESALEQWCVAEARRRGIIVSKITDPTGIMDHCFWFPGGSPWLIEFKDSTVDLLNPKEGVHDNQWYYLIALAADGYRTAIVTTKEGFMKLLNGEHSRCR